MLGIVLGLGSSLAWGVSDFLGGMQSRRRSALAVLLITQPLGLIIGLVTALLFADGLPARGDALLGVLAGVIIVSALVAFYRGMAIGPVSIVATIASLGALVSMVGGLAQGDDPSALQLAGAAIAIAGVVLVSRQSRAVGEPIGRQALVLALAAAAGIGTAFLLVDAAAGDEPTWAIVALRVGGISTLLAVAAVVRPEVSVDRASAPALLAIAVLEITANMLFAVATNHGLISLVSVAGSLY
ncbi:MAG TPA: EamA family transporter [Solirubrobacterales bacterium]|nr:EamA family transporter [Solirubrobacterales bacterium]